MCAYSVLNYNHTVLVVTHVLCQGLQILLYSVMPITLCETVFLIHYTCDGYTHSRALHQRGNKFGNMCALVIIILKASILNNQEYSMRKHESIC